MNTRLLNAGDTAGTKKDPNEFSSPIVRASSDINIRKGNIHRVKPTAKSCADESKPGAMMRTRAGAKNIPKPTTINVAHINTVIVARAKANAFSLLLVSA